MLQKTMIFSFSSLATAFILMSRSKVLAVTVVSGIYKLDVETSCYNGDENCDNGYNVWSDIKFTMDGTSVPISAIGVSSSWNVNGQWSQHATTDDSDSTCYWPGNEGGSYSAEGSLSRQDSWHLYEVTQEFNEVEFDVSDSCGYPHNINQVCLYACSSSAEESCDIQVSCDRVCEDEHHSVLLLDNHQTVCAGDPPTLAPVPTLAPGAFGDPHFKTWNGELFDFHGLCDLVLVSSPLFGDGVGLDVHIRTKKTREWSYVDSAAVRIGLDILEVRGGKKDTFWINGIQGNNNTEKLVINNYPIEYQHISEDSKKFVISLGDNDSIVLTTWKSFVSVKIENPKHHNFARSVGLMGSFPEGSKIGRDNSIIEDFNVFGLEWQVLFTEQNMFHNIEGPQHPLTCVIPSSMEMRRRLAESSVTLEEAEKVCSGVNLEDKEVCIFDVMATNDLYSAGVY